MKKAYFGMGISVSYLNLVSGLAQRLKDVPFDKINFILADSLKEEYNDKCNYELADKIELELKKFNKTQDVLRWKFIEKQKDYNDYRQRYFDLLDHDPKFFKDITKLVLSNRDDITYNNLRKRAGYVIGELASITIFSDEYVKLGPKTEIPFDNLAIKYPLDKKINGSNFYYI